MNKDRILSKLYEDMAQNAPIIGLLKKELADVLYFDDENVIVRSKPDDDPVYFCNCRDLTKLSLIPKDADMIVALNEANSRFLLADVRNLKERSPCYQVVFTSHVETPALGIEIRVLDESFLADVVEHYEMRLAPEYILERLSSGVILGAFLESELAGFIGRHFDGSMGMLEVFLKFRSRGIGRALEAAMINRVLASGEIAYGHIFESNAGSLALQKKFPSAIFAKQKISWLRRQQTI